MKRRRSDAVKRAIANALMSSAGLGAFAVAVGHLGLDGATELCATRTPPPELLAVWETLGYTAQHLPTSEELELLLLGVEIQSRQVIRVTNKDPRCEVRDVIDDLCDGKTAMKALRMAKSFGVESPHLFARSRDIGAI